MENPYSPSCVQVGPGPHTQTLESKTRLGKLTVFCVLVKVRLQILCKIGSQNKAWESCVPSCAPIQVLALIQRCALHKTLWPKNKDWKTYSVSCVLVKVHAPIQRCALHKILSPKKKRMKNLPSFLCTEQGPHTNPKCVLSTNPFRQKNKDRKTYLVSCVLVKIHTPVLMCAQHKTLWPKKQGLENLPCFLCPGQGPHTNPRAFLAQTLWWEHGGCWGLGSPPAHTEIHPLAASFC